ncbi:MAG: hypothetical protein HY904_09385 [Deltaproteobacteria bacterium]|nr:hypothetical protein [Deltaproteobacteria bacterium]
MRRLLLLSLLLAAPAARAGVYMEETTTVGAGGQNQSTTAKIWVEGDMVRTDMGSPFGMSAQMDMTLIINTRKVSVTGVNKADKTFWKLRDQDVTDFGMATLMAYGIKKGPDGKVQVPARIFEKTGEKKKVKVTAAKGPVDVEVEKVKVNVAAGANEQMKGVQSVMWVGQVPGLDPSVQRTRVRMWMGTGAEADEFLKQYDELGGVPVITEMSIPAPPQSGMGQLTTVQQLTKVAPSKLAPKDFDVPKAFRQTEDPFTQLRRQMPQRGAPGAPGGMPMPPSGNTPPPMQ